jgi:hypothetical protein
LAFDRVRRLVADLAHRGVVTEDDLAQLVADSDLPDRFVSWVDALPRTTNGH